MGNNTKDTGARRERSLATMLRERDISKELLPYEKFEKLGPGALDDAELLAIIIRTGSASRTPMEIGQDIISGGGCGEKGLSNLYRMSVDDLMQIPGVGRVKAVKLKCITELSRRMIEEKCRPTLRFPDSKKVARYYMERLRHEETEKVMLLSLNSRMKLLNESIITTGTVNRSLISPREIYIEAIKNKAVNIIVMHNHPGGDPTPSNSDFDATDMLVEAGKVIEVSLVDHLIIGDGCYYSFKENGYFD